MVAWQILRAWKRILAGYTPYLSLEITRECPLSCPGCYAYGDGHLGGGITLRELRDYKGSELVERALRLLDEYKPVHVSIVGGEPLVRYRELSELLPQIAARGIGIHVVTSAVRPIPAEWASLPNLAICVSVDGLAPEHDERRKPATYDRILQNIYGHPITVHWTVTRQQAQREGYLEEFVRFWSAQPATRRIWTSLYTPQIGEASAEQLTASDRQRVLQELLSLCGVYRKLNLSPELIAAYVHPPASPAECTFARLTHCVSADLESRILPCQFGGNPDCANCGCMASAVLAAVARHRLPGGLPIGTVLDASLRVGATVRTMRESFTVPRQSPQTPPTETPAALGGESI